MPYLEVDVPAGDNAPYTLNRMFSVQGESVAITRVWTSSSMGEDGWLSVTGWVDAGPCPAYAVKVEDSGDGVALLVYGGDQGIRLKPLESKEPWDTANSSQWGEPCLLLAVDTKTA